jgi:hypothetical protein
MAESTYFVPTPGQLALFSQCRYDSLRRFLTRHGDDDRLLAWVIG